MFFLWNAFPEAYDRLQDVLEKVRWLGNYYRDFITLTKSGNVFDIILIYVDVTINWKIGQGCSIGHDICFDEVSWLLVTYCNSNSIQPRFNNFG